MDTLKYRLELLTPSPDTVQQRVEIKRNGSDDVQTIMLDANDREIVFDVPQDAAYELALYYVDDAGNDSTPAILSGVAIDTIPPAPPQGFGSLTLIGETEGDAPADPPAEESVVEESVVEEPVADEPVVEEPVVEEPVVEEPVAEEPVAEEPVAEEPVAEAPTSPEVVEETPAGEIVTDEPTDEQPL